MFDTANRFHAGPISPAHVEICDDDLDDDDDEPTAFVFESGQYAAVTLQHAAGALLVQDYAYPVLAADGSIMTPAQLNALSDEQRKELTGHWGSRSAPRTRGKSCVPAAPLPSFALEVWELRGTEEDVARGFCRTADSDRCMLRRQCSCYSKDPHIYLELMKFQLPGKYLIIVGAVDKERAAALRASEAHRKVLQTIKSPPAVVQMSDDSDAAEDEPPVELFVDPDTASTLYSPTECDGSYAKPHPLVLHATVRSPAIESMLAVKQEELLVQEAEAAALKAELELDAAAKQLTPDQEQAIQLLQIKPPVPACVAAGLAKRFDVPVEVVRRRFETPEEAVARRAAFVAQAKAKVIQSLSLRAQVRSDIGAVADHDTVLMAHGGGSSHTPSQRKQHPQFLLAAAEEYPVHLRAIQQRRHMLDKYFAQVEGLASGKLQLVPSEKRKSVLVEVVATGKREKKAPQPPPYDAPVPHPIIPIAAGETVCLARAASLRCQAQQRVLQSMPAHDALVGLAEAGPRKTQRNARGVIEPAWQLGASAKYRTAQQVLQDYGRVLEGSPMRWVYFGAWRDLAPESDAEDAGSDVFSTPSRPGKPGMASAGTPGSDCRRGSPAANARAGMKRARAPA